MLYCETIEGWFFASSKFVNVTAKDNGGKPVGLTLTYSKEIDAVKDNAVVLNICKGLAEAMAVPYSRVTDAYGGYHGKPSGNLPAAAAAAKPAAAANKTATATTKTRVLQATTATTPATTSTATTATTTAANATAAKQTEWKLNLFVQPDPFADTVDNAATVTLATGTAATAAINKVTSTKYGTFTAVAAAVTEKAVKFSTNPVATGGTKQATIAGAVDVASYVYCAVAKTASSRRRLQTTTAATTTANATANATKPAAAAVKKEVVNLQGASDKYNIQRFEAKAAALKFSFTFKDLLEGKTYGWMCEATSLSPTNPAFRTAM